MRVRGLYIALAALALLTGTLYWSNRHKPADDSVKAPADAPPNIVSLNEADLTKVDLRKKDGNNVSLARDASGNWEIVAPKPMAADQSAVSSMLSSLSSLTAERLVDEKASNLSQYGLQTPALEVDAVNKNNKSQRLLFGDDTPTGSGVYATLAGDPRVFTIATYTKSSIDKSADDLQDKRLLTLNPEKISRIELITKNQTLEFGRAKDDWEIIKPRPLRADSSQIRDLLTKLTEARMDAAANDIRKTASAFSSGIRVATAKLTGDAGVQQLEIHKNKDDFYAKSSAVGGIYKVSSDIGQALEKKLDDFRSKKIFDLGFENPDKVEIRDGSKVYALRRNGEDWVSADGRKLDSSSVQPLLGDLRGLVASKFVDSVGAKPVIEMSVTSDDGKRVEKVQIAPSGTAYVAKREGDSTHYLVDSNSVADLQKAASNLKAGSFTKK